MIPSLPAPGADAALAPPSRARRPRQGPAFPLPPQSAAPTESASPVAPRLPRKPQDAAQDTLAGAAAPLPSLPPPLEIANLPTALDRLPPEPAAESAPDAPVGTQTPPPDLSLVPGLRRAGARPDSAAPAIAAAKGDAAPRLPEPPAAARVGERADTSSAQAPAIAQPLPTPPAPPLRPAPAAPLPAPAQLSVAISSDPAGPRGQGAPLPQRSTATPAPAAMPLAFGLETMAMPEAPPAPAPAAAAPLPRPEAAPSEAADVRIGIDQDARLDVTIAAPSAAAALRLEAGSDDLARDLAALGSEVEAIRVELRTEPGPDAGADGGLSDGSDAARADAEASRRDPGQGRQTEGEPMPSRLPFRREPTALPPAAPGAPGPAAPSRIDRYA